jgi:membrane protein required for beta-lactamase induction
VLCLTAIETGIAAAEALDPALADGISEVRSITDWVPAGVAAG